MLNLLLVIPAIAKPGDACSLASNINQITPIQKKRLDNRELFKAIKAKAAAEGLSIVALAARSGVSRPQISNALAGRTRLSPAAMSALREYANETTHQEGPAA
jgi:ABC-type uncharacterized transport system substrate-binding protein